MKKIKIASSAFGLLAMTMVAYAWGSDQQGTEMLNAHGEAMELDFKLYDPGAESVVD